MKEGEQGVGLAATERGAKLEHPIARPARERAEHVDEQRAHGLGEVGGGEELVGVGVDSGTVLAAVGHACEVGGVGAHGEIARGNIGVRADHLGPGAELVRGRHSSSRSAR